MLLGAGSEHLRADLHETNICIQARTGKIIILHLWANLHETNMAAS